jgi:hypothetical protein
MKKQCNIISTATEEKITRFYERDVNSRATTGEKDTLTRNKNKKQKLFLSDTIQNLYQKFKREYSEIKMSN